jgi:phage shock protein A
LPPDVKQLKNAAEVSAMNLFKRWTVTASSGFDWMISQVENHEALVGSALKEMQETGAKASAQVKRVKRDGERLNTRIDELMQTEMLWEQRALRIHESDRERAVECLRRKKQTEAERLRLQQQRIEHQRLEQQLSKDVQLIEERIATLKRRKNAMSAREYRADALAMQAPEDVRVQNDIDEMFERWENRLDKKEAFEIEADHFEESFVSVEEREDLSEALDDLISSASQK